MRCIAALAGVSAVVWLLVGAAMIQSAQDSFGVREGLGLCLLGIGLLCLTTYLLWWGPRR